MSEASLAAQKFLRTLFIARSALTDLVPATSIFDRNSRPEIFPCILIGEATVTGDDATCIVADEIYTDVHVWTTENGLHDVKQIAGEIRRAVRDASDVVDGFALDAFYDSTVFLRDPDGEHSHAVVTIKLLSEDTVGLV